LDVELNLTDLTKFVFPRDPDPRDFSNLSYWVDALTLVARLKDGSQNLTDPDEIQKHSLFQDGKTELAAPCDG
jgi:hypothetical protein